MEETSSHRACAACRAQKVRCIPADGRPDECQRCNRAGRPCVFTPLQKRRQRKRTDIRVAELEREMRQMRSQLQKKELGLGVQSQLAPLAEDMTRRSDSNRVAISHIRPASSDDVQMVPPPEQSRGHAPVLWPAWLPDKPSETARDAVDRGILSMATARLLFETYRRDCFHHYPLVYIPPSFSADEMRRTKPTLFLATIAAASAKEDPSLSAMLDKEVLQSYALRSLIQSQKCLELVQALLISAVWYHPPQRYGQLKYYEYISMAASMALDIGIGASPSSRRSHGNDRPGSSPSNRGGIHPIEDLNNPDLSMSERQQDSNADTASTEARRTFLSCYLLCSGVSLSLRRPTILRMSSYVRSCVDHLETAPDTTSTDLNLAAWGRLMMMVEEITTAFSYDDPGALASIADVRTQMILKDFSTRLTTWYRNVDPIALGTGSLSIMYYTVRLYLYEIVLHVDHSPEDFKAPYQMGGITTIANADQIPSKILVDAIAECVSSAHALLTTFLGMDVSSLRALPVFSFVRIAFAAFILAKLCLSAADPHSRLGHVIDVDSLQTQQFLDRSILHIRDLVGDVKGRLPSIFLALLFKLRQWCLNPRSLLEHARHDHDHDVFDDEARNRRNSMLTSALKDRSPRIIEQISSDESSPSIMMSGLGHSSTGTTPPILHAPSLVPASNALLPQGSYPLPDAAVFNEDKQPPRAAGTQSTQQRSGVLDLAEPADIDNNLFAFLEDLSMLPEGDLDGFNIWANVAQDLADMSSDDIMNWQMPSEGSAQC